MRRVLLFAAAFACLGGGSSAWAQQLNFNIYGDTMYYGWDITTGPTPGKIGGGDFLQPNTTLTERAFVLPRVATVISGSLGRLTVLNETTFTAPLNQGSNTLLINVERFEIGYQFAEWLRIKAGRLHSAFGYYNDAYHTGFYYQLPPDRPAFVNYEDNGGLIPARVVGLHADGRLSLFDLGHVHYDVELLNDRAQNPTEVTIGGADGRQIPQAFNTRLRFEPGGIFEGLIIGANFYTDHIVGSTQSIPLSDFNAGAAIFGPILSGISGGTLGFPAGVSVNGTIQTTIPNYLETIFGVHLVYLEHNVHFIAEYAHFNHRKDDGSSVVSEGGFVEAGYAFGDFTPFVLVDRVSLAHGRGPTDLTDPYFAFSIISQAIGSYWKYTTGVRWQPIEGLALKLCFQRVIGDGGTDEAAFQSQAAVAF